MEAINLALTHRRFLGQSTAKPLLMLVFEKDFGRAGAPAKNWRW
jgi:hypothetical protein